jgi:hypothetical protein
MGGVHAVQQLIDHTEDRPNSKNPGGDAKGRQQRPGFVIP